ncbi:hypothetical protein C8J57DRAFT_592096 [Mycena rebaudengoi]|nr:hypothetical protein C8J57DRAFT_592096 [Mycena rebaudengoi]
MSFPKGPRFDPQPISDVPGPNSYNLYQESQLDAYKRGALYERTDRFGKDCPSDVPGPGTYNTQTERPESKSGARPPTSMGDRYSILQRKVEELERIHNDGKKTHQSEVDRLKLELSRSQKTNTEQAERLEKQRKQNAALDLRIQDLKKASATEQAELKDLRVKLRMSEHERVQLSSKQGEAGELRKSMQALESKRREEVRERDRAIAELEKSVAGERKRKESAEARLQDLQGRGNSEVQAAQEKSRSLQAQLEQASEDAREARQLLSAHEAAAAEKHVVFLEQLEQYRVLLSRVAEEYGRLVSSTVSADVHSKLKHTNEVLQIRTLRLARKLANSDGQVTELANLIRHAHDTNAFLVRQVRDLQDESDFCREIKTDRPQLDTELLSLYGDLSAVLRAAQENERRTAECDLTLATSCSEFYRATCDELLPAYAVANMEIRQEQAASRDLQSELKNARSAAETLAEELAKMSLERDSAQTQLVTITQRADELKITAAMAEQQRFELEQTMAKNVQESEVARRKDKKTLQSLTETVQRNRMTEEGLRSEINLLTTELADSEQFQSAYYSLSDEVRCLIARNELAEGEAEQLSKFNAEILGHHNPAQRIVYVDRIRRELADTKHKLAVTVSDYESTTAHNVELIRELEMYKSAAVPVESKPRTIVTRISRPPLSNLNQSTTTGGSNPAIWGLPRTVNELRLEDLAVEM